MLFFRGLVWSVICRFGESFHQRLPQTLFRIVHLLQIACKTKRVVMNNSEEVMIECVWFLNST